MAGHGEKLSRKQEQAIAALLSEPSLAAAAAKVKIGKRTLAEWLLVPGFKAAYQAARQRVLEGAVNRLLAGCDKAMQALERNLTCGAPSTEVRAALGVLGHALKGMEVTAFAERLAEIEEMLKGKVQ
jgi:hypothetical protein